MSTPFRFGSAVSLAALASMIAGCAAPQHSGVTPTKLSGEVGLATRAAAALSANDPATAIPLAERAVERTPDDAGLRTLLGNAYFAAGRFVSAEGAYKDSLALSSNQAQVILKLALVETALGKRSEALAFLEAGRSVIDPADYGLAVALAGRAADALPVLESAARSNGADSRVRQNLALAYALAGDWTSARTVAAQDVSADMLDARIQQWMQFAIPRRASDQVATLLGVTPAGVDQGRPQRLALVKDGVRMAEAPPVAAPPAPVSSPPEPVAASEPEPQFAAASGEPTYYAEAKPVRAPQPVEVAPVQPTVLEKIAEKAAAPAMVALAAVAAAEVPTAVAALAPKLFKSAAAPRPVRASTPKPVKVAASRRNGNSSAVVQLGAYGSPQRVLAAWNNAARKYPAVRAYMPMSARFSSARGTVYRLAVKGFANNNEANALCASVRRSGGSCFVRNFAGDTPVQYASR